MLAECASSRQIRILTESFAKRTNKSIPIIAIDFIITAVNNGALIYSRIKVFIRAIS